MQMGCAMRSALACWLVFSRKARRPSRYIVVEFWFMDL